MNRLFVMVGLYLIFILILLFNNGVEDNLFVSGGCYKGGRRPKPKEDSLGDPAIYTGSTASPAKLQSRDDLPKEWNWCDVEGISYCTASWNQHIPRYCGSCWVHGSLAAANDRIKILLKGRHDIVLARQVILNCGAAHGLGSGCDGGEDYDVFEYMHRYGLPDETCQNYVALESSSCNAQTVCQNCMPIGEEIYPFKCWPVLSPILYYTHSYGQLNGELQMMSEIISRGPITCGFASTDEFDYDYRGGIFTDTSNATELNHDVEVVGWGVDIDSNGDETPYWLARNSWGSYWGMNSFFKVIRGINNMQFESECVFALFDVHHVEEVLDNRLGGSMFGVVVNNSTTEETQGEKQATKANKKEKTARIKQEEEKNKRAVQHDNKSPSHHVKGKDSKSNGTLYVDLVYSEHVAAVEASNLIETHRHKDRPHSQSYKEHQQDISKQDDNNKDSMRSSDDKLVDYSGPNWQKYMKDYGGYGAGYGDSYSNGGNDNNDNKKKKSKDSISAGGEATSSNIRAGGDAAGQWSPDAGTTDKYGYAKWINQGQGQPQQQQSSPKPAISKTSPSSHHHHGKHHHDNDKDVLFDSRTLNLLEVLSTNPRHPFQSSAQTETQTETQATPTYSLFHGFDIFSVICGLILGIVVSNISYYGIRRFEDNQHKYRSINEEGEGLES